MGQRLPTLYAVLATMITPLAAQEPAGLAARALTQSGFTWERRETPGFRVYFLADSYPSRYQDSLLARLRPAARHAESLIQARSLTQPIDLFFVESREQMTRLIGGRATGFAQPSARAVFLMTNPSWRAFERHEIMHVIAGQAWGWPPAANMDWLVEGLAQAADGRCGAWTNEGVVQALAQRRGWIPLQSVLAEFRSQPDLRAYLQAAAFVAYLLPRVGPERLRDMWVNGVTADTLVGERTLRAHETEWRRSLAPTSLPTGGELDLIEEKGCG
jgi:hypothetical protein